MSALSRLLIGKSLNNNWHVVKAADRASTATGGLFSDGFIATNPEGKEAFVKVLDLSRDSKAADPLKALQSRLEVFNYERDLLQKCSDRRMSRVVRAIDDGHIDLPGAPLDVAHYLIFEMADSDVRSQSDLSTRFDLAFALRTLHHTASGIQQLHLSQIAHQDIKPSNVLIFENDGAKIGDLGHAHDRTRRRPGVAFPIGGDPAYAAPEQLYNHTHADWDSHRYASDLYLFGSMILFMFTGAAMTPQIASHLDRAVHWSAWRGTYGDVLPFLRSAVDRVIEDFKAKDAAGKATADLAVALGELCEPDPALRGHPHNRAGRGARYSAERYVSLLNLHAGQAEYDLKRSAFGNRR